MKGKTGKGCYKKGGAVKGTSDFAAMKPKGDGGAKNHKVHGVSAKTRLDKKGRGKIATVANPISGAAPKGMA